MAKYIAVKELRNGVLSIYGEGDKISLKTPDLPQYISQGAQESCLECLDGKLLWKFQCSFYEKEQFMNFYKNQIKQTITVSIGNEIKEYVAPH
jgi:hypothetical protein